MPEARVHRIPTAGPDDVSGLEALIASGEIDPAGLVAVLGKTEGNGCVNDFTRAFAVSALEAVLGRHGIVPGKVAAVMSGGTEGGLSPHLLAFERIEAEAQGEGALAIGAIVTPDIAPEEIGTPTQIERVAAGVAEAMAQAGLDDPDDIHFVQVKCPLLTAARIETAQARGAVPATTDTLKSMGLSRGASALGVAVALGEITTESAVSAQIGTDTGRWSGRASTSAGVELMGHEILVLGMSKSWSGPFAIDHAVMQDAIDTEPVRAAFGRLGLPATGQLTPGQRPALTALLAKTEASGTGAIRGARHIMRDDSDISATRHARAFTGGALAALTGMTELFVSGGAEHQGPDGGGPVAIIVDRSGIGDMQ